ncbi:MAG: outer membrane beta-barrel protein [Ramlibacter sp.]
MKALPRALAPLALAAITAIAALPAAAQTSTSSGSSMMPGMSRGYMGLNIGQSDFRAGCGNGAFACDDSDTAGSIYFGSMFRDNWGAELGYVNMGRVGRGGGDTRAHGLNLSLVGKAPLTPAFSLLGKVGTTYGRTETTSAAGSGVTAGSDNGFGLSYGIGASYDFTPNVAVTVNWDSHDFRFAGGRDPVRMTSVGLQYRF